MKIQLEVYDLNETLYTLSDNRIITFQPNKLEIISEYMGYTGEYWGDQSAGRDRGWPIKVRYTNSSNMSRWHNELFRNTLDLKESL